MDRFATGDSWMYLYERVVQDEHDGCEVPGCPGVPEQHLSNITDISGFGVPQTELPGGNVSRYSSPPVCLNQRGLTKPRAKCTKRRRPERRSKSSRGPDPRRSTSKGKT